MLLRKYNLVQCVLLVLCLNLNTINSYEYFSSITGLESLLKTEEVLLQDLRKYIELTKKNINVLESELQKIEEQHRLAQIDIEDYLTNPVNVYLLIKRLHSDWNSYKERLSNENTCKGFLNRLGWHRNTLNFPDEYDMYGAAVALMRLQSTYKLKIDDITAGTLNGIQYGTQMNWHDCYELGRQLHSAQEYNFTKLWFKKSIKLLGEEKFARDPVALDFMEIVAESLLGMGDIETAYNISSKVVKLDAGRVKAWDITFKAKNMLRGSERFDDSFLKDPREYDYYHTQQFKTYEKLCRAEIKPAPSQERQLRCRYVTNNVPYRLLAPFKIEEHNLDPLILTIHEAMSSKKAEKIKELAIPDLQRSGVRQSGPYAISDIRVSKNAWLPYKTHPYTVEMLRDLHDATKLDVSLCEDLQVANYGLGGHYEPHWDFYLPEEMSQIPSGEGNRIATAIFYLSDVAQGGATVFPYLNISIWPHKGSILFWFNLHHSLERDYRTVHAGCPVLKGSKWIGNVWVNDITQTFSRPCLVHNDHEKSLEYAQIK